MVRGGPSNEHEVSLNTGKNVLDVLRDELDHKYQTHDILIDRQGVWHFDGMPIAIGNLGDRVDVVFNALHGTFGEDGKVQHIFEANHMPFTGSGSLASAVGMHKVLSKEVFNNHNISTAKHRLLNAEEIDSNMSRLQEDFYNTLLLPVVVKPARSGSSVGVTIVKDYKDLPKALWNARLHDELIMIEDFVKGIEATCGVMERFRGEDLYALPPVEIRPKVEFFDYEAKYNGQSEEIVPATFAHSTKEKIQELAKKIHRALGLRHYSRSDFIIHPKKGIFVLEVNTLPGLTKESLLPKSLRAVGSDLPELIDHLVVLAGL